MSNKPDFIFIGPGRSGTTFIYNYLKSHPQVCLAKDVKEINYFNDLYETKLFSWYCSFFSEKKTDQICGEVANMYFYDANVAKRIKDQLPDVNLFTILRNPFERIISAYQYRVSVGEIIGMDFDSAVVNYPDLVEQNLYSTLLKSYFSQFKENKINIFLYDDLKNDESQFLHMINESLGIDYHRFTADHDKKNARNAPRFKLLTILLRFVSDKLRKYHLYKVHTFLKNNKLIRRFVFSDKKQSLLVSEQTKAFLKEKLQPEIDELAKILNRDLSHWKLDSKYEAEKDVN